MKKLLKIYVVHITTGEYSFFDGDTFEKITDVPEYWLNEAKEVLKELFSNRRVVFGYVTLDFICEKLKSQMA